MIEITRSLARHLRTVLRRTCTAGTGRGYRPDLTFSSGADGLTIRALNSGVGVELHIAGAHAPEVMHLSAAFLDDCEGSKDVPVTLEHSDINMVQVRWDDAGVAQVREYATAGSLKKPGFPARPARLTPVAAEVIQALDNATQCVGRDATRYALDWIQLRGKAGEVVATDGHQLLVHGGFSFPWKEDVLIPVLSVFGCRVLPPEGPVEIGRTDGHVCIRVGPWIFYLPINQDGRFPKTESIIPAQASGQTICRFAPDDAAMLVQSLPRLPGAADDNAPVTVDLNGHVLVRARADGQQTVTQVDLDQSEVTGPPVRFVTDRRFLARALAFNFNEFQIGKPDAPIACRNGSRTYVWVPLSASTAIPPVAETTRTTSSESKEPRPEPTPERSQSPMNKSNGHTNGEAVPTTAEDSDNRQQTGAGIGNLIEETEALRDALQDACGRAGRLLGALKRYRKQSKLVSTALTSLASLRELQHLDR